MKDLACPQNQQLGFLSRFLYFLPLIHLPLLPKSLLLLEVAFNFDVTFVFNAQPRYY